MYPFFSELPLPMNRVFTRLIFDHLHTFSLLALFLTVFGYHVQLTNSILKKKSEHRMYSLNFVKHSSQEYSCIGVSVIFKYVRSNFFPIKLWNYFIQNIYQYSLHSNADTLFLSIWHTCIKTQACICICLITPLSLKVAVKMVYASSAIMLFLGQRIIQNDCENVS